jgi:alkylation response protein AidB-like acyl-CoA dehydrogenase
VGTYPILQFGTKEQKEKYLPKLTSGGLGAFALTEPGAGSDAKALLTKARADGDDYIIEGAKTFITNGGAAETIIVIAKTKWGGGNDDEFTAFIVEKGTGGFSVGKVEDKMGIKASQAVELIFDQVRVPKENILGKLGEGLKIALASLDGGRIGIASQAVGIAQGALDESISYSKERFQFGKPISSFQGIQFKLADMATRIDAARQLVHHAASLRDQKKPFSREAAQAKLFASGTAVDVVREAVQIHGGHGYMRGSKVERLYRDAKITEIYEGTNEVQRMVIARSLLK